MMVFDSTLAESYSVSELTAYIRDLFELDDCLQDVWVTGEISNLTQARSGHWYFTVKDDAAQIKCVMWRSTAERQTRAPQEGDAAHVHGRVTVYEPQGIYQLYADRIRPVGIGNLYQAFERLKARLDAEGLFDQARKRPIPAFPRRIGVVTSPAAAAFQDIQNVLRRRYPLAEVILSPTLVQGDDAPPQIVAAVERLNRHTDADVILLCRGGGSIEDLWAFNDERVARAIAASRIPVISGVGHEIDFTIADFAADLRAPTPSAAAELATPDGLDLRADLRALESGLTTLMNTRLADLSAGLAAAQRSLRHVSPVNRIANLRQRIDDYTLRVTAGQQRRIDLLRERVVSRAAALNAASPQSILKRGYTLVTRSEDGRRVHSAHSEKAGTGITVQFYDGAMTARVEDRKMHEQYRRTLF